MRPRSIIHLNIANFSARLEAMASPDLRDKPVVVAPLGAPRAVVYDMNELAFRQGIRKQMPLSRVLSRHRGVRVVPPRFNRYAKAMEEIMKQGLAFTPAVESGFGDGHLFLDITGTTRLYGPGPDVAFRLKKAIKKQLGLDPVWALACNKLVAKAATRLVKPSGEYIVGPGEEADFLAPLSLKLLPGLSRNEARTAARFNLETVSHLRRLTPAQLAVPFADRAYAIHRIIQGIDTDPVRPGDAPQLAVDHEFATDTNDRDELKACIAILCRRISRELARGRFLPQSLGVSLAYADGIQHTRQCGRVQNYDLFMFKQAWALFVRTWKRRTRVRHICLTCRTMPARLGQPCLPGQTDLFQAQVVDEKKAKIQTLKKATLQVMERFGPGALTLGAALKMRAEPLGP